MDEEIELRFRYVCNGEGRLARLCLLSASLEGPKGERSTHKLRLEEFLQRDLNLGHRDRDPLELGNDLKDPDSRRGDVDAQSLVVRFPELLNRDEHPALVEVRCGVGEAPKLVFVTRLGE